MRSKLGNVIHQGQLSDLVDAPDVIDIVRRHAKDDPDSTFVVYTSPRQPDGIHWSMRVTGPRGCRNLDIHQRKPTGSVLFT